MKPLKWIGEDGIKKVCVVLKDWKDSDFIDSHDFILRIQFDTKFQGSFVVVLVELCLEGIELPG